MFEVFSAHVELRPVDSKKILGLISHIFFYVCIFGYRC